MNHNTLQQITEEFNNATITIVPDYSSYKNLIIELLSDPNSNRNTILNKYKNLDLIILCNIISYLNDINLLINTYNYCNAFTSSYKIATKLLEFVQKGYNYPSILEYYRSNSPLPIYYNFLANEFELLPPVNSCFDFSIYSQN